MKKKRTTTAKVVPRPPQQKWLLTKCNQASDCKGDTARMNPIAGVPTIEGRDIEFVRPTWN
jgi:hypothetical protein